MSDQKYLEDPRISQLLDDFEEAADKMRASRQDGNYAAVSLYLGMAAGTITMIHARNSLIDQGATYVSESDFPPDPGPETRTPPPR